VTKTGIMKRNYLAL